MSFRCWDGLSFELPGESQWVGLNSLAPYHLPPVQEKRPVRASEPEDEMLSAVLRAALTGSFLNQEPQTTEPYNCSFCSSNGAANSFNLGLWECGWFQGRYHSDAWPYPVEIQTFMGDFHQNILNYHIGAPR